MFDSIKDSTLMELGNIIAGSYLTAIIDLTGVPLTLSVPTLAYGTVDTALPQLMKIVPDQDVFLIENSFLDQDKEINGQFLLIPESGLDRSAACRVRCRLAVNRNTSGGRHEAPFFVVQRFRG